MYLMLTIVSLISAVILSFFITNTDVIKTVGDEPILYQPYSLIFMRNIEKFEEYQKSKTIQEEMARREEMIAIKKEELARKKEEEEKFKIAKQEELQLKIEELDSIEDKKEWFLAYKDLIFKYAKWSYPPGTVYDAFSEEEVILMCRTVETECFEQDFNSKVNVANVIFNRLDSGKFGDTVTEIITKPNQFAYGRKDIVEDTIYAVMYAFEMEDTTQGALYFHSKEKTETFNRAKYIFTDDAGHHFYKPEED